MRRPLRSLMIGDTDHYFSPYVFGVAQACHALGMWHSQMSIRNMVAVRQRLRDVQPDVIWLHMGLWPPGTTTARDVAEAVEEHKKRGVAVFLHDGDVKARTRYPQDVSSWIDLALCNHRHDRSAWGIPQLYWPYAAFLQEELAEPDPTCQCDLLFAGKAAKGIYDERGRIVEELKGRLSMKVFEPRADGNTMFLTPTLAASALCVLGFGRPDQADWVDTRVFQYPGAGAILVHDDVRDFLPMGSYAPYDTGSVDSIIEAVERVKSLPDRARTEIRRAAFEHVQLHHSWLTRVQAALEAVGLS